MTAPQEKGPVVREHQPSLDHRKPLRGKQMNPHSDTTRAPAPQLNFAYAHLSALTALNLIHGAFMLIEHRIGDIDHIKHDAENWAVRDILYEATERFQVALDVLDSAATRANNERG